MYRFPSGDSHKLLYCLKAWVKASLEKAVGAMLEVEDEAWFILGEVLY
jgi:hypothetical protein